MKRIGGLYDQIWQWDTLRAAFHKARKGARRSREALEFEARLDENLRQLQDELRSEEVCLAGFTQFVIHDPKERTITAPAFRDRVLHHAIMQVCEPHFDRWLIPDSYACRKGKGRLAALERATQFAKKHGWFLKLDIRKYFESIPHDPLLAALGRKFKDRRLMALLEQIVRAHESGPLSPLSGTQSVNVPSSGMDAQRPRVASGHECMESACHAPHKGLCGPLCHGLPIGSLTSQHLANFYLGAVDRLARETLRVPGYVRYMDDFILWEDDPMKLRQHWQNVRAVAASDLGLELKASAHMNRTAHGMDFCGFRIFPGWRVLNRRSRKRLAVKLRNISGLEDEHEQQKRAESVIAFAREGNTWHDRHRALARASTA